MSKLIVVVPVGRRASGRATLLGNDGRLRLAPFRVLAAASLSAATRHGNPEREWRRPFGHMPTGSYVVAGAVPPSPAPQGGEHGVRHEPLGALILAPVGGNALEALRAGRTRFLLHGGPLDPRGLLRCTFGGLRISDADLIVLLRAINQANGEGDPLSTVEVDETSTPPWTEESADEVPSSRGAAQKRSAPQKVPRDVLTAYGFGGRRAASTEAPGRRAFFGLALFTFGALAFACGGAEGVGGGDGDAGPDGGHDGGGGRGGYEGGVEEAGEGGGRREGGPGGGGGTTTGGGGGSGTTTTGTDTTTTGTDTTTTGTDTTTTGTDTTTTGTVTTGTDTTTTGTDTTTTGTDTTTTGTDTTTTGTDTTTTGTDTTTTGTDTTTTGTDTTTTGTDTTTADVNPIRRRHKRRKPARDEGSGT